MPDILNLCLKISQVSNHQAAKNVLADLSAFVDNQYSHIITVEIS